MPSGFDARELENLFDGIEEDFAEVAKECAIVATINLREATPKDTWHASVNWIPTIGEPFDGLIEGTSHLEQEAALEAIRGFTIDQGAIFITNNVPYIQYLIDGSSEQAPAGWDERAIDEAIVEVAERRDLT